MTKAKTGDKVMVTYLGTLDDGSVFDSSLEPLEFIIGERMLLPLFEDSLIGMEKKETKTVIIAYEDAYGPYDDTLVFTINKSKLPPDFVAKKGKLLQGRSDHGDVIDALVTNVEGDEITMDANHELAGQRLTFEITLLSILSDPAEGKERGPGTN